MNITTGQDQDIIAEAIGNYLHEPDLVGVWWIDTAGEVFYSELDTLTAKVLFTKCAKVEAMSTGLYHVRLQPLAFRRSVYATGYRSYFEDKIKIEKAEFDRQYKEWLNGRNKYGYNKGNFAEWLTACFYGQPDHFHHNAKPGEDIVLEDGTKIEVKCLAGCSAQIPLSEEFLHSIDIW